MLYTSEVTGKSYKTVEELESAEAEFKKQEEEKKALVEVKRTRAKEVQDAYDNYFKVRNEAFEKIKEAETKLNELKNKFIEDYGSFHMTYTNNNGNENLVFGDLFDWARDVLHHWPF